MKYAIIIVLFCFFPLFSSAAKSQSFQQPEDNCSSSTQGDHTVSVNPYKRLLASLRAPAKPKKRKPRKRGRGGRGQR